MYLIALDEMWYHDRVIYTCIKDLDFLLDIARNSWTAIGKISRKFLILDFRGLKCFSIVLSGLVSWFQAKAFTYFELLV